MSTPTAIDDRGVVRIYYGGRWITTDVKATRCADCDEWKTPSEYQRLRELASPYCRACRQLRTNELRRQRAMAAVTPPAPARVAPRQRSNVEIMSVPQRAKTTYCYWVLEGRR